MISMSGELQNFIIIISSIRNFETKIFELWLLDFIRQKNANTFMKFISLVGEKGWTEIGLFFAHIFYYLNFKGKPKVWKGPELYLCKMFRDLTSETDEPGQIHWTCPILLIFIVTKLYN